MATAGELTLDRVEFDLRATWQARILAHTHDEGIGAVVLSVLSNAFDDAIPVLLAILYPDRRYGPLGFVSITAPFICSTAKVDKSGHVVADVVARDERVIRNVVLFRDEKHLRDSFRRLADRLRLTDAERCELFTVVKRWVVADTRLDPTMDPQDPDARRLLH